MTDIQEIREHVQTVLSAKTGTYPIASIGWARRCGVLLTQIETLEQERDNDEFEILMQKLLRENELLSAKCALLEPVVEALTEERDSYRTGLERIRDNWIGGKACHPTDDDQHKYIVRLALWGDWWRKRTELALAGIEANCMTCVACVEPDGKEGCCQHSDSPFFNGTVTTKHFCCEHTIALDTAQE